MVSVWICRCESVFLQVFFEADVHQKTKQIPILSLCNIFWEYLYFWMPKCLESVWCNTFLSCFYHLELSKRLYSLQMWPWSGIWTERYLQLSVWCPSVTSIKAVCGPSSLRPSQQDTPCCRLWWSSAVGSHIHMCAAWQVRWWHHRCACVCAFHHACCVFSAGLRRAAVAALGQELSHLKSEGHITCPVWSPLRWSWTQKKINSECLKPHLNLHIIWKISEINQFELTMLHVIISDFHYTNIMVKEICDNYIVVYSLFLPNKF